MTLPRWDEDMKFELLRLKSELRPENFKALHTPIGLARASREAPKTLYPQFAEQPSFLRADAQIGDAYTSRKSKAVQSSQTQLQTSARSRLDRIPALPDRPAEHASRPFRFLIIHTIDLLFVATSLIVAILFAAWLSDPEILSRDWQLLKNAPPLPALLSKPVFLLGGLYGFFLLYWAFFKGVAGATLGESFFAYFRPKQNSFEGLSDKLSGDS